MHKLILMQISYHKAKVRLDPQIYDTKWILSGYKFPTINPNSNSTDEIILWKLGIRVEQYGSSDILIADPNLHSFADYMTYMTRK